MHVCGLSRLNGMLVQWKWASCDGETPTSRVVSERKKSWSVAFDRFFPDLQRSVSLVEQYNYNTMEDGKQIQLIDEEFQQHVQFFESFLDSEVQQQRLTSQPGTTQLILWTNLYRKLLVPMNEEAIDLRSLACWLQDKDVLLSVLMLYASSTQNTLTGKCSLV